MQLPAAVTTETSGEAATVTPETSKTAKKSKGGDVGSGTDDVSSAADDVGSCTKGPAELSSLDLCSVKE
jgi:hypothetical protein